MVSIYLRKRWKLILILAALWLVFLFPIPLFPFWGIHLSNDSIQTVLIISLIVSIPFTFLAIFMKPAEHGVQK